MEIIALVVAFASTTIVSSRSVVDVVSENTTWILKELSVVPAMTASIEYQIQFPVGAEIRKPNLIFYYNGQKSPNIVQKCGEVLFGQLRNEDLGVPLSKLYRRKFTCYRVEQMVYCSGKTKIQDFEPKSYSFSLGFSCNRRGLRNLYGLYYNVSIYAETNKTSCVNVPPQQGSRIDQCKRAYSFVAIPNQIGSTDIDTAIFELTSGLSILDKMIVLMKHKTCLKKLYQMLCLTVLPECRPEENRIILPCREECDGFFRDCLKLDIFGRSAGKLLVNCDYLPSRASGIGCTTILYKDDGMCGSAPQINQGLIQEGNTPHGKVGDVVHYACHGSNSLCGSAKSTCLPSGEWSRAPACRNICMEKLILIQVGCFVLLSLVIVVMVYCVVNMIQRYMRYNQLKRATGAESGKPLIKQQT